MGIGPLLLRVFSSFRQVNLAPRASLQPQAVNPESQNPKKTPNLFFANPRKLEHGFRRISARIPYTLPQGHEANDVPTFWLLL